MTNESTKTLPQLIAELKDELTEFAATRLAMLRAETNQKLQTIKLALPSIVVGLMLVVTGWLLFSAFLVCAIASAFNVAWRYPIAFLIVAALYSIIGFLALFFAWQRLKQRGLKPQRTIQVLKDDQIWLQTEVKAQL